MAQPNPVQQFEVAESGVFDLASDIASEDFSAVATALKQVQGHSLQAALEAGEIIFRFVFNGDEELLRARGRKCSSFRKLSAHPELKMSSSSLWRAVAIYELSLRFPEIVEYAHTGVGHISVVLGLPAADQFSLLRQTEAERWTRRKLQRVVTELRIERREGGQPSPGKVVERLSGLAMLAHDIDSDRRISFMGHVEARQALELLGRVRELCAGVENKLYQSLSA